MPESLLVVIPCLNEERTLEPLVHQLIRESKTLNIHIVIADGGSNDGTIEIAKRLATQNMNVTYLHNPKRLQSAAVNLAVTTFGSTAEFLIRIDAHAGYPDNYCQALVTEAQVTKAASVVVTMHTSGIHGFQSAVAAAQNSKLGNGGSAHRSIATAGCWVDHGHHALIRIDAFRAVGGYDESFSHNEDAELDTRLAHAGFKIWLTAKTSLTYYPRSTPGALFRQYAHYGKGRVRTMLKHRSRPKLRQLMPVAVYPAALLACGAVFWWPLLLPIMAWILLCLSYGLLLGIKAKNPAILASGYAAMIMHFAWSVGFWRGITEAFKQRRT